MIQPEDIDVKKLKLIEDKSSPTGYSIVKRGVRLTNNPDSLGRGIPASLYLIAAFWEIERLNQTLDDVLKQIDVHYGTESNHAREEVISQNN